MTEQSITVGELIAVLEGYPSDTLVLVGNPLDDLTFPRTRTCNVTPVSMDGTWWREDEGPEQFLAVVIR